jgi:hypothetical protein
MLLRCGLRRFAPNQFTPLQLPLTPCRSALYLSRLNFSRLNFSRLNVSRVTVSIACLLLLGACNHQEYKSDLGRTANRKVTTAPDRTVRMSAPGRPLLASQPAPNCEFTTNDSTINDRQRLDYERQCYRHAEMIARDRLEKLQASIDRPLKTTKKKERAKTGVRSQRNPQHFFWSHDWKRRT